MKLPRYPAYKDSGVKWIGDVPAHWEVATFKRLLDLQNGADHKAIETDDGIPVIGSGGAFAFASKAMFDGESVLLGRKGTIDRPVYVNGPFWTVDTMYWSKVNPGFSAKFAYYAATTIPFGYYSTNTALPSMTKAALNAHAVACPAYDEQSAIAAFLDRETAKIEALIAEQERLLSLLAEKRQAVISHAVTKGLNPNAPMKDSGVQWLGEVPAHWQVLPIKAIGLLRGGAGFPDDEQGLDNEELGFYKVASLGKADSFGRLPDAEHTISRETADRLRAFIFPKGTVVFAKVGAALMLGRFGSLSRDACIDNNMMGFITAKENEPDFLRYSMHLIKFDLIVNPGAVPSVNGSQIGGYLLPLPSREEQIEIVEFIESETSKLDALRDQAVSAIELLRERRATLISAAVTGQVDVRRIA